MNFSTSMVEKLSHRRVPLVRGPPPWDTPAMRLHLYPDPVLIKRAPAQTVFDDELRRKVAEMFTIMYEEKGVGLAAP